MTSIPKSDNVYAGVPHGVHHEGLHDAGPLCQDHPTHGLVTLDWSRGAVLTHLERLLDMRQVEAPVRIDRVRVRVVSVEQAIISSCTHTQALSFVLDIGNNIQHIVILHTFYLVTAAGIAGS